MTSTRKLVSLPPGFGPLPAALLLALVAAFGVLVFVLPVPERPDSSEAEEAARRRMVEWAVRDAEHWQAEYGDRVLEWDRAEGHLALVIDDVGRELHLFEKLHALRSPLTFSVLPGAVYAVGVQERLAADTRRPREIWLHLPMEPVDPADMTRGAEARETFLLVGDSESELRDKIERALEQVDPVGVNNHMGSRLTSDPRAMEVVMRVLGERELAFIDSRTTGDSRAEELARASGLVSGRRQVFLDHDPSASAIARELRRAADLSRREPTIAIAHPSRAVVEVLEAELPALHAAGIGIYPASAIVHAQWRGAD